MSDWKQVSDADADRIRGAKPGHGHVYRDGRYVEVSLAAAAQVIQDSMSGFIKSLELRAGGRLEDFRAEVAADLLSVHVEIDVGGRSYGERFDLPDIAEH